MRKGVAVILLLAAMLLPRVMLGVENKRQLAWGVNAVVLKVALERCAFHG
jgi:hypothetical protein